MFAQEIADALPGDGHQSEIVKLKNFIRSTVDAHASSSVCITFWRFPLVHVYKIGHNDAAQIAQRICRRFL